MAGDWPAAYLAYVLSGYTGVQPWWTRTRSSGIWEVCGFDSPGPSHSEVQLQFGKLEEYWTAFATVAQGLIRQARDIEPRIGEVVFVDATQWLSAAALEHCCPPDACPNPRRRHRAASRDHFAALEAHWKEDDEPEPEEDTLCERTRRGLETLRGVWGDRVYQRFVIDGCHFRSRDLTSGVRRYAGTNTSWFGGYTQAGVDMLTGAPLAVEVFPADVMEWDHYPQLFRSMVAALGEAPYVVSVDRGYSIKKFFEFNTRRGVTVVAPLRERTGRLTLRDWRTDAYDEDGIPRCQACGNEGHQDGPGLGLSLHSGTPLIRYRCIAPIHEHCESVQSIACSTEWAMLLPLSRKTELYHSIRHAHHNMERVFDHLRDRYSVAGKDTTQRIRRKGADAQRLRAWAAVLLDWFRLSIGQGWQAVAIREGIREPVVAVRRSGRQDLESGEVLEHGVGSERLGELIARRQETGLDVPYGPSWERMKRRLALEVGP